VTAESEGVARRPSRRQWACLTGLALLAGGFVLLATHDGVPVSADNAVYAGVARSIASGHGLEVPIHYYPLGKVDIGTPPPGKFSPTPTPLVVYAPLAPVLLAAGGQHPVGAGRVEDTIFFGLTVLLVGLFVFEMTGLLWPAAAAQLILGLSLARLVDSPGTVAPTLFFTTVALVTVLRYRERSLRRASEPRWPRPGPGLLATACLATGLATLVWYAAGGLIVWGALVLRRWPRAAVGYLVGSGLPLLGWFVYEAVSGRSTGHFFGFHVVKATIRSGVHSLAFWILPVGTSTGAVVVGAVVVLAVVAVALGRAEGSVPWLLVGFGVVQVVVLEVAVTFVDAGVDLDSREFVPIYLATVTALAVAVAGARWTKVVGVAAVAGCALRFGIDAGTAPPGDYTTPGWEHSPVVADVRRLPADSIIYTDAPDVLYVLDGRATSSVPETVDFSTLKDNPRFETQLAEIRRTLTSRGGYVVWVRGLGRGSFLPSEATVRRDLDLRVVEEARDGAVYRIARR